MSEIQKNTGIKRIIYAARYSWLGLIAAWKNEAAFRQEVVALIAAVIIALLIDVSLFQKMALVGSVVFVMIVELMNSAVEAVVDRIGLERHELSGRAKDLGSAAVFLAIGLALMIWSSIFWSHFIG
ncbi:diacylglycerol kinase [Vibrio mediterranei]|uniref:Diacylglycerol kinase n=1 Tax=Vibrio mediterranei TaxID=689 RepID=A0ABX5DMP1_9VIBR|nr:diacylglycerol kinase [Vibrio mediterranei]MCG9656268.1 diacylglycerol kinase [Vibrio mediterranei]PCD90145.1 diacylglycerol kinase [Vibrio mediterranei]PRQ69531.1 diacylglycerol kinase [Vibrio mediterranei]PTC06092.1 diacylglycerol kinase [Vibrio mediterranei]SBO10755.1 Diacylglycerol kinase [Vibrio mediterranei]